MSFAVLPGTLPSSAAALVSNTSPEPTDPNRCLNSVTIGAAPGSSMAPKRLGKPATDFGAGMTSGPATLLAAASPLAIPRAARLTVAQTSTAAAPSIKARKVAAQRVFSRLLRRLPGRLALPGQTAVGRSGKVIGRGGRTPGRRVNSARDDREPRRLGAVRWSVPGSSRSRVTVHGPAIGSPQHRRREREALSGAGNNMARQVSI